MSPIELMNTYLGREFTGSPSPFMRWLKPVVRSVAPGQLTFEYRVREEWLNPVGNLHGGVTAAIIDDILGATMYSLDEQYFYTTIDNTVNYFAPVKVQETIFAETTIVKKGRQFIHAECSVWNAGKSRLVAKGISNLFKTEQEKPRRA